MCVDIFLKSLLSGGVTALILLLAKYAEPKLAGALGGIPIVFAVSYVLITYSDKALAKEFLVGGIYGALAGVFFCAVLLWFNYQFGKSHWLNFAVAYGLCFLFAYMIVRMTGKG